MGQSVARNYAISKATGEYLYFMDSDDILVQNALEYCYKTASENGLDVVTFDADTFSDSGKHRMSEIKYNRKGKIEERVYSGIDMAELMIRADLFRAAPWLLFVKRKLLKKYNLTFYPGIIHEDELFTPLLFISAHRVSYISRTLFLRRIRSGSTMTKNFSQKNIKGYFTVVKELQKHLQNSGPKAKFVISKRIKAIVNSVSYQSNLLGFKFRMKILVFFIRNNFLRYVKFKNLVILLFPFTVRVKSRFRSV
jgi:glycosyltransferase involved in cell wall biosynthesis